MIIPGWTRNYIVSAHDARRAREILIDRMMDKATTDDGKTVFIGMPFTRAISELRDRMGRMPGRWGDQHDLLEALGFKVVKARIEISYNSGKFRGECHVVYPDENFDERKLDAFTIEEATFLMAQATKVIRRITAKNNRYTTPSPRLRRGIGSY